MATQAIFDDPPTGFVPPPGPVDTASGYTDDEFTTLVAPRIVVFHGKLTLNIRFIDEMGGLACMRVLFARVQKGYVFQLLVASTGYGDPKSEFTFAGPKSKNRLLVMDAFGHVGRLPPQAPPPPPQAVPAEMALLVEKLTALVAVSQTAAKATEANTKLQTELSERQFKSVSTYDEVLVHSLTTHAIRKANVCLNFSAPQGTAQHAQRKVLDISTESACSLYDTVVKYAGKFYPKLTLKLAESLYCT